MKVKFKDGHEIEFKQFDNIWLADSVIWENTNLHGSLDELRELKSKVSQWFIENAPEEIRNKFVARLPLQEEIEHLPFKNKIAYKEDKADGITEYFIGDEDYPRPVCCLIGYSPIGCSWFYCFVGDDLSDTFAVRLCLKEKE